MNKPLLLLAVFGLVGCDRDPFELGLVPEPGDVSPLLELAMEPMTEEQWNSSDRESLALYADVGAPSAGEDGGIVLSFKGTGSNICVMVDPEAVFWNLSVSTTNYGDANFRYPDNYNDDGDLDLAVGLAANYTGYPGKIGDFEGTYTDSLGGVIEIEYDLCRLTGKYGNEPAHAGRGTVEYCTIDTVGREGIDYLAVFKTFSLPVDDSVLSFAAALVDVGTGDCEDLGERVGTDDRLTECSLYGESKRDGYQDLEDAFCYGELYQFCVDNPDWCGDAD